MFEPKHPCSPYEMYQKEPDFPKRVLQHISKVPERHPKSFNIMSCFFIFVISSPVLPSILSPPHLLQIHSLQNLNSYLITYKINKISY